jgi:transposase
MPLVMGVRHFFIPATSRDRLAVVGGEDLELHSREPGVTAAGLSRWRGQCLNAGGAELKKPSQDGRGPETMRLRQPKRAALMSRSYQRRQIFW